MRFFTPQALAATRGLAPRVALAAFLSLAGLGAPLAGAVPVAAAAGAPKVVIIVGPAGSATPSYRADADAAANEALKYTSNVVRIYSPNATWAVVQPALQGASIVIYMGHGNGFPSPRTATLVPDRQNGLGLNPTAGVDDTRTQYWGERSVAGEVRLAPNAVVVLGHLCYASGSSEPGYADPTRTVAEQRVDNFAAGFLAAGARAVIAEAYKGAAAGYVRALFTAHSSIGAIWATSTTAQGNIFAFASTRTPGMTAQMDPDKKSGKYWRSIVGDITLAGDAVTGGSGTGATAGPAASPTPRPGTTPDPGPPAAPAPTPTPTPTPVAAVDAVDAVDDAPRMTTIGSGPVVTSISAPKAFSPNGDGRQDAFPIRAQLSTPATWAVAITDAYGSLFYTANGTGDAINVDWDGTSAGASVPDGVYMYRIVAADGLGGSLDRSASVHIDTTAPALTTSATPAPPAAFSPNGDGQADTWTGIVHVSEPGSLDVTIVSTAGVLARHLVASVAGDTASVTWNGRTDSGAGVADGQYYVIVLARDAAGNPSASTVLQVTVYRAITMVAASTDLFYPQDNDRYATATQLSFNLSAAATVTWAIEDLDGRAVVTKYQGVAMAPGTASWFWTGVDGAGAPVAPGSYAAVVTVTNGTLSNTVRTPLTVAAFRITTRAATAMRGQSVTVTAMSAEPLSGSPRLTLRQPGVASRTVAMTKVAPNTYRVTTRLSTGGSAGALTLVVSGTDASKGRNVATVIVPLR